MKYRILYFIVLTSIFKSCIMLSCYGCFSCNYILDYITVFECEPGESCVTIVMAGLTFQDGYTTTVHRQCQGGYRLSNGTELGLVDWDYWVQSFCSSHNQDIAHLDTCLAIHCDTDLCNSLPVESLAVTKAAPSTYSSGGIEGFRMTEAPLLRPQVVYDREEAVGHNNNINKTMPKLKKTGRSHGSRCSIYFFVIISFIISLF